MTGAPEPTAHRLGPLAGLRGGIAATLDTWFGVDTRSLAATRIATALVALADLASRGVDAAAHYSDAGVLPRAELGRTFGSLAGGNLRFSLLLLDGSAEVAHAVIGLGLFGAALLLVGWWTRAATFATWLAIVSLQHRNPYLLDGGDRILVQLLFFGLFLPWGARWSLDAATRAVAPPSRALGPATALAVLLMPIVYFVTGYLKDGTEWRVDLTAVHHALGSFIHSDAPGRWLVQLPLPLLKAVTVFVLVLELLGPVLLFWPRPTPRLRAAIVLLFAALQAGIFFGLYRSIFAPVSVAASLVLLPAEVWGWLGRRVPWARASAGGEWREPRWLTPLTTSVLVWVLASAYEAAGRTTLMTAEVAGLGAPLRLEQAWQMFAPNPPKGSEWLVVPARLSNGTELDLVGPPGPVDYEIDPLGSSPFHAIRWRNHFRMVCGRKNLARRYAEWACRSWNAEHPPAEALRSLRVTCVFRVTRPDGREQGRRRVVHEEQCATGG